MQAVVTIKQETSGFREPNSILNQEKQQLYPSSNSNLDQQTSERVVASRWQNEVMLPCKFLNLDEEQTVSRVWYRDVDELKQT